VTRATESQHYEGKPLQTRAAYLRSRAFGWLYGGVWIAAVVATATWLEGGTRVFVLLLLGFANPAGTWGISYGRYRQEWKEANVGGLASATEEHSRALEDGRELKVARLPSGDWQAWVDSTAALSGMDESLADAIWAALGHEPPEGPAAWMRSWAQELESVGPA
jgi:hypothetical protein